MISPNLYLNSPMPRKFLTFNRHWTYILANRLNLKDSFMFLPLEMEKNDRTTREMIWQKKRVVKTGVIFGFRACQGQKNQGKSTSCKF